MQWIAVNRPQDIDSSAVSSDGIIRVQNKISARGERGRYSCGRVRIRTGRPYFDDPTSPYVAALFGKNQPHPVMDLFSVVLIAGKSDILF